MSKIQNFETSLEQLKTLIEFRKNFEAPVDQMGCAYLGDKIDPKTYRFQTLIALMLSSQTKDQETSKAINKLKTLPGGLNASTLSNTNPDIIFSLISNVGFANKKKNYIIEVAKICQRDFNGDIPSSFEGLTSFSGVGIKMATLAMAHCWNQQIGIGVDVHVHRISNILGWVKTKNPDDTEKSLQLLFPKELWEPINHTLVGFGQTICNAKKPKCEICPINSTCKFFNKN